jgi:amino acid adenylation domain-containing protein
MSSDEREGRHLPFPLTDLQQAYWVGERADLELGGGAAYRYLELDLAGEDVPRVEAAWRTLIDRHDMLRAVVLPDGRQQVLAEVPGWSLQVEDLRALPAAGVERQLAATRERMARHGPGAGRWPLFELLAHLLPGGRARLCFSLALLPCDGWSLQILLGELEHLVRGGGPLPDVAGSFRDWVLATEAARGGPAHQRALQYWRDRLATLPPPPHLPRARRRAADAGPVRLRQWAATLSRPAWEALKARGRSLGLLPSLVLCAAYAEALGCWSRDPRFCLTFLTSNRPARPEGAARHLVGNFSSTVLLEVADARSGPFRDRAIRLQMQLGRDRVHRGVSGVEVAREAARLAGRAPVASPVVFASVLAEESPPSPAGPAALSRVHHRIQTPHVLLDHSVGEDAGALVLRWEVAEAAFPDGMIDDLFGEYCRHLDRLASEEGAWEGGGRGMLPVHQLRRRREINATAADRPPALLHQLFAARAAGQPASCAVIAPARTLTYAELDLESTRLARRLRRLGARPETLVAVAMERGWEQVVAVLGVLKAGAAYVPLDPHLPAERLALLVEKSRASLIVTQPWLEEAVPWPGGATLVAVGAGPAPDAEGPDEPEGAAGPDSLAYVIYTSGSTGEPKGVMIDHRGAVNTILDLNRRFEVTPADRVLALSSLSFDLSVYDVFGTLAAGGAVVVLDERRSRDPAHWLELCLRHRVTVWSSVPALMQLLVEHAALAGRTEPIPSLRLVMLSGDWIPLSLPDQVRALAPAAARYSLGGATEASIWSILYPIQEVSPDWPSVPYGRPMENQQIHVLDGLLHPRPDWVPGMLYIGGIGLARGYWRDPVRTAAAFIALPETGERLYRTGDWGRWLPDGNVELLGRDDQQVKIRGFRIELGEIEAALRAAPGVGEAVVLARDANPAAAAVLRRRAGDPPGPVAPAADSDLRLVAYVVPRPGSPAPDPESLRAAVARRLPDYMVPAVFVVLDQFPLSANGKVDRRRLPAPGGQPPRRAERQPPRDALERDLVALWEEILGVGSIGVHDNFFELGGHSLLGLRLMARLKAAHGRELPLSALLEAGTVAGLAALLRAGPALRDGAALVLLHDGGGSGDFFCVHASGGNVLSYSELSRRVGPVRFRGLQAPALVRPEAPPPPDLESLAAGYLAEVRAVQPAGPYRLGGWSFGGLVAYQMACHLAAAGEAVQLLALIDAWPPTAGGHEEEDGISLLQSFARDLDGGTSRLRAERRELEALAAADRMAWLLARAVEAGVAPPDVTAGQLERLFGVFAIHRRLAARWRPPPYPGPALLLRARDRLLESWPDPRALPALGWDRHLPAGALEVVEVPGNHYTVLAGPGLEVVAAAIRRRLA